MYTSRLRRGIIFGIILTTISNAVCSPDQLVVDSLLIRTILEPRWQSLTNGKYGDLHSLWAHNEVQCEEILAKISTDPTIPTTAVEILNFSIWQSGYQLDDAQIEIADTLLQAMWLCRKGDEMLKKKQPLAAIEHYNFALQFARSTKSNHLIKRILQQLTYLTLKVDRLNAYGNYLEELLTYIYQESGRISPWHEIALPLYQASIGEEVSDKLGLLLALHKTHHHRWATLFALSQLLHLDVGLMNIEEVRSYANEAVVLAQDLDSEEWLEVIYERWYQFEEEAGFHQNALQLYQQYIMYGDAITRRRSDQITEAYQKQVNVLELENLYQSQVLETTKKTNQRNILSIVAILIVAALLVINRNLRERNKIRQQVNAQDALLQEQRINELQKKAQLVALNATMSGQESERKRIAEDLHDGLGGLLTSIKIQFRFLEHEVQGIRSSAPFLKTERMLDRACQEVRRIAHNMMPETLFELGLVPAIEELIQSIPTDALDIHLQIINTPNRCEEETEIMVYRITQEIINNVLKHALATKLILQFAFHDEMLHVVAEDDGIGFAETELTSLGKGLNSIKSRVEYLQGEIEVDSRLNVGTTISISIPVYQPSVAL